MSNGKVLFFLSLFFYVDDMLHPGPNEAHIVDFNADLNAYFDMSILGLLHHYLGI